MLKLLSHLLKKNNCLIHKEGNIYNVQYPTKQGYRLDWHEKQQMSHVLRKLDKMHVRKVSSQISLCSPHRLIQDDTFRLNWIFAKKRHHVNEKFHKKQKLSSMISLCRLHRLIWDDNLRSSIMPSFLRTRHKFSWQWKYRAFPTLFLKIFVFVLKLDEIILSGTKHQKIE